MSTTDHPARMTPDEAAAFVRAVVERTSGSACGSARRLMASEVDEAIAPADRALVEIHLDGCPACQAVARVIEDIGHDGALLGEIEPDPRFVEQVLAATSRRPPRARLRDVCRDRWARLAARPRLAWEVAYVLTVCWVLAWGHPVIAWEWTASRVRDVAQQEAARLGGACEGWTGWHTELSAAVDEELNRFLRRGEHVGVAAAQWSRRGVDLADSAWTATLAHVRALVGLMRDVLLGWASPATRPGTEPRAGGPRSST